MDENYTYWSAGEMRRLKMMKAHGQTNHQIAINLGRSEGAIKARLYYLDIARLATITDDKATLVSLKNKE